MHRTTATLLLAVVAATASLWVMRGKACGQFFVTTASGNVSEYTTSGATLNTSLVTGLSSPSGIAVYASNLFVADRGNDIKPGTGTIDEYTTSGTLVNTSLVTGLYILVGIGVPEPSTWAMLSTAFLVLDGNRILRRAITK